MRTAHLRHDGLFPTLSRSRPPVDLSWQGRRADSGTCMCLGRLPKDHSGRQRQRVYLPRSRSLGLCQRHHVGLLMTWKANSQRVHRGVQFETPGKMCERAHDHQPCRRSGKAGRLLCKLQRGSTPQSDRIHRPDRHALSRWRHRPIIVKEPGNSSFRRSKVAA